MLQKISLWISSEINNSKRIVSKSLHILMSDLLLIFSLHCLTLHQCSPEPKASLNTQRHEPLKPREVHHFTSDRVQSPVHCSPHKHSTLTSAAPGSPASRLCLNSATTGGRAAMPQVRSSEAQFGAEAAPGKDAGRRTVREHCRQDGTVPPSDK